MGWPSTSKVSGSRGPSQPVGSGEESWGNGLVIGIRNMQPARLAAETSFFHVDDMAVCRAYRRPSRTARLTQDQLCFY